jgi:hypothetical protein
MGVRVERHDIQLGPDRQLQHSSKIPLVPALPRNLHVSHSKRTQVCHEPVSSPLLFREGFLAPLMALLAGRLAAIAAAMEGVKRGWNDRCPSSLAAIGAGRAGSDWPSSPAAAAAASKGSNPLVQLSACRASVAGAGRVGGGISVARGACRLAC